MSKFPNASGFYFKLLRVIKIQPILLLNIILLKMQSLKQTEFDTFFFFLLGCSIVTRHFHLVSKSSLDKKINWDFLEIEVGKIIPEVTGIYLD